MHKAHHQNEYVLQLGLHSLITNRLVVKKNQPIHYLQLINFQWFNILWFMLLHVTFLIYVFIYFLFHQCNSI